MKNLNEKINDLKIKVIKQGAKTQTQEIKDFLDALLGLSSVIKITKYLTDFKNENPELYWDLVEISKVYNRSESWLNYHEILFKRSGVVAIVLGELGINIDQAIEMEKENK